MPLSCAISHSVKSCFHLTITFKFLAAKIQLDARSRLHEESSAVLSTQNYGPYNLIFSLEVLDNETTCNMLPVNKRTLSIILKIHTPHYTRAKFRQVNRVSHKQAAPMLCMDNSISQSRVD